MFSGLVLPVIEVCEVFDKDPFNEIRIGNEQCRLRQKEYPTKPNPLEFLVVYRLYLYL